MCVCVRAGVHVCVRDECRQNGTALTTCQPSMIKTMMRTLSHHRSTLPLHHQHHHRHHHHHHYHHHLNQPHRRHHHRHHYRATEDVLSCPKAAKTRNCMLSKLLEIFFPRKREEEETVQNSILKKWKISLLQLQSELDNRKLSPLRITFTNIHTYTRAQKHAHLHPRTCTSQIRFLLQTWVGHWSGWSARMSG